MPISIEADPTLAQGYIKVNGTTAATITTTGISGNLNPSVVNSQTVLSGGLAATDEFLVWDASTSALRKVTWNDMQPVGTVLKTVGVEDSTYRTLTYTTNWGDANNETALPSIAGGVEVLSASIQPSATANKVLVSVEIPALAGTSTYAQLVLFRGTTAIQSEVGYTTSRLDASAYYPPRRLTVLDSPNTTSNTTYSVRVGYYTGGTFYLNGVSTGQRGGGVYKATLILQEIKG